MDKFRGNGDWWIPEFPDQKVSGQIIFNPSDGVELGLNGELPSKTEWSTDNPRADLSKRYPLIYGDLGQEGPVTIQDAAITSASFGGSSQPEDYLATRLLVGEHLSQSPSFVRANFVVDEIPSWTGDSTVKPVFDRESVEEVADVESVLSAYISTEAKQYSAQFDELKITVSSSSRISSTIESVEMETVGLVKMESDNQISLDTIFNYGNKAMEYISFAVGTGVYPEELRLYTEGERQPVEAYYLIPDYTESTTKSAADYLFRPDYADFETTFQGWVRHCEEAPEVHDNYRHLIHRSNLSPKIRFLVTVIGLEAYHDAEYEEKTHIPSDEFEELQSEIMDLVPSDSDIHGQIYGLLDNVANTPSIKDKLVTIMGSEDEIINTFFDISDLATEARDQRNLVAHGSSNADLKELDILSKQLELVLEVSLARKIGVPAEQLPNCLLNRHQGLMRELEIVDS